MLSHRSLGAHCRRAWPGWRQSQEQLSTGRVINRPSDHPTGTTAAMRIRSVDLATSSSTSATPRTASAGSTRLDGDAAGVNDQVRRARDLALQGAERLRSASGRARRWPPRSTRSAPA